MRFARFFSGETQKNFGFEREIFCENCKKRRIRSQTHALCHILLPPATLPPRTKNFLTLNLARAV